MQRIVEVEIVAVNFVKVADLGLAIRAEEAVKAALDRQIAPLPLAHHHGVVTRLLKGFGNQRAARHLFGLIPVSSRVSDLLAIEAGQQRDTRRAADRIVIELG